MSTDVDPLESRVADIHRWLVGNQVEGVNGWVDELEQAGLPIVRWDEETDESTTRWLEQVKRLGARYVVVNVGRLTEEDLHTATEAAQSAAESEGRADALTTHCVRVLTASVRSPRWGLRVSSRRLPQSGSSRSTLLGTVPCTALTRYWGWMRKTNPLIPPRSSGSRANSRSMCASSRLARIRREHTLPGRFSDWRSPRTTGCGLLGSSRLPRTFSRWR
jgi:hypothetical protein